MRVPFKGKWDVLCRRIYGDYAKSTSVFIAGSGRSGTTWLAELINRRGSYRIIFEPYMPEKVPIYESRRIRPYCRSEDEDIEFTDLSRRILEGQVRCPWTDKYISRPVYHKRLVKEIRANLFLKWLRVQFPSLPMVFMMRHPCAVLNSQRRLGWFQKDALTDLLEQDALVEDFLLDVVAEIREERNEYKRRVWLWVIENYVPLRLLDGNEYLLVFYEDLVLKPEPELARIAAHIGDFSILGGSRRQFAKPSRTAKGNSSALRDYLGWAKDVTKEEVRWTMEILDKMKLSSVYGGDALPRRVGVAEVRKGL